MSNQKVLLTIAFLTLSTGFGAQNIVTIFSSVYEKGQPVPEACRVELAAFRAIVAQYPHPQNWKWYLFCDDPAWNRFLVHEGIAKKNTVIYAETSIVDGMSFLKGTALILTGNMAATPDHVVVHELAHIMLRSRNEDAVDAQCNRWISQQQSRPGSLVVAVSPNPIVAEARPN